MTTDHRNDCADIRPLLGAAVLGLADPSERRAVETHVTSCSDCAAIRAELIPLPDLLGSVDASDVADDLPPLPAALLRRTLDQVAEADRAAATRHRTRRLRLSSAAAVASLAATAVIVLGPWNGTPDTGGGARRVVAAVSDPTTDIRGSFVITAVDTGSQVRVSLSGVRPGERCRLLAVATSGEPEVAATWVARYDGTAVVTGNTGLAPTDITGLQVVTEQGRTLLRANAADLRPGG